jgi:hypothetical protein
VLVNVLGVKFQAQDALFVQETIVHYQFAHVPTGNFIMEELCVKVVLFDYSYMLRL